VNRWGLAEMHGHLLEWCQDVWHPSRHGVPKDGGAELALDPSLDGMVQQLHRVLRGGSWSNGPRICRSAFRYSGLPKDRAAIIGLRPCCVIPQDAAHGIHLNNSNLYSGLTT